MYSDRELAALYPADYYAYQQETQVSRWKQLAKRLLGYWQGTNEPRFSRRGRCLDIGCGAGSFVQKMLLEGWESHGVEINRLAAEVGSSRGLDIHAGDLQSAQFPDSYFDYVRASHSLEHVTSPQETLLEINRILRPGGIVMLAVPNVESLNARIFKENWWHLCVPVHPFSFSAKTLTRLVANCGFLVETVRYNSDYVGTLGSVQIWLNRNKQRRSSQGLVFNSRTLRVLSGWLQKVFDLLGWGDMIEITAIKPALNSPSKSATSHNTVESMSRLA